jgi:hypothetical protein
MAKPLSYDAAHRKIRAVLAGKPCEHCQLEVALKHEVPADRLLIGRGRHDGLLYSDDPRFYRVLCTAHHRLSDARARRIHRGENPQRLPEAP